MKDAGSNEIVVAPVFRSGRHRRGHFGRRRRLALALIGIVAIPLVSLAIWQVTSSSPTSKSRALVGPSGGRAAAFTLPRLSNPKAVLSLASLRGRPVVINFWASWCVPCRHEMPLLEKAYRAFGHTVEFVGIDANDTAPDARAFLAQVHVGYPTLSDPTGAVANRYGLYGLPTTVFISSTGMMIGRHLGELNSATLRTALREAFGV